MSLKKNETWTLEEFAVGVKQLSSKWVFKVKTDPNDSIVKYKANIKQVEQYDKNRNIGIFNELNIYALYTRGFASPTIYDICKL